MMLAQRANLARKGAVVTAKPQRRSTALRTPVASKASASVSLGKDGDVAPGIAAGLFVAFKQGMLAATADNLRMVLAVGALALPAASVLLSTSYQNEDAGVLGPAALAAEALKLAPIGAAAIATFGTTLCSAISTLLGFSGAYYVMLASLGAALYADMGGLWICATCLIHYGNQFLQAAKDNVYLLSPAALSAACVYALVRYFKDGCSACATEIAIAAAMARVAWGLFQVARQIVNK